MRLLLLLAAIFIQTPLHAQEPNEEQFMVQVSRPEIWQYGSYIVTAKVRVRSKAGEYWQVYYRDREHFVQADSLVPALCRFHRTRFTKRPISHVKLPSGAYSDLTLDEVGVSPTQPGIIEIPSLSVKVVRFDAAHHPLDSVTLHSQPVSVTVKEIPLSLANAVYQQDAYCLVGPLRLNSSSSMALPPYAVGDTIRHAITLTGRGSGHAIEPVIRPSSLATVSYKKVFEDTAYNKSLRHHTTFDLEIIPHQPGTLRLEDLIQPWAYFSMNDERVKYLSLYDTFTVSGQAEEKPSAPTSPNPSLVIVLDVSRSMCIRDYERTRVSVGVDLANLLREQYGTVPVVVFAGNAEVVNTSAPLDTDIMQLAQMPGTAIGDALWQAKTILGKSLAPDKRIILIGDGDNTVGATTEALATHATRRHGINVHTVGLGYSGVVPFGWNSSGDTTYIENSYQDQSLKEIARLTGGKFTWISKDDDLAEIAKTILE